MDTLLSKIEHTESVIATIAADLMDKMALGLGEEANQLEAEMNKQMDILKNQKAVLRSLSNLDFMKKPRQSQSAVPSVVEKSKGLEKDDEHEEAMNLSELEAVLQNPDVKLSETDGKKLKSALKKQEQFYSLLAKDDPTEEMEEEPSRWTTGVSTNVERTTVETSQSSVRVPSGLPKFRGGSNAAIQDPQEFIDQFRRTCVAHEISKERYAKLLPI